MPTIAEGGPFTRIVEFDIQPARQLALIDAIVGEVERWVRHCPGFVSSIFHASHDGKRVINYAQWRDQDALEVFTHDPRGEALSAAIRAVGPDSGSQATHYRVIRAIEAPGGAAQ